MPKPFSHARDPKEQQRLVVYECRGDRLPDTEPRHSAFLGLWAEPPYFYLFFKRDAPDELQRWLRRESGMTFRSTYRLYYRDWQKLSEHSLPIGPFEVLFGEGTFGGRTGRSTIRLASGVAFGSGLHPTTQGCLVVLATLCHRRRVAHAVDLGTGTGILALACGLLGVSSVLALDCNPVAAVEARENVRRNGLEGRVHVSVASGLAVCPKRSDLLVMNLEWPSLVEVLEREDWKRFDRLVVSGFLKSRWPGVLRRISPRYGAFHRVVLDDWVAAGFEKNRSGRLSRKVRC